jgi:periplasmic copper chaperone A
MPFRRLVMALFLALAAAAVLALPSIPTFAHSYKLGALDIGHPWTRVTPKGAKVAGGYLKVTNNGDKPERLVGGSAEIAGRFEIHEMRTVDGVMRMRPLPKGVEIKPGETLELKPGSYHLMFMDLKRPLKEGERVKGTLVFETAGTVAVEFAVESMAAKPGHDHGGHKH